MTPEQTTALRAPFPIEQVGLLPKITCGQCSKSSGRVCAEHKKSKCNACDNYITERHIHLDYVGHGAVTDRLLTVDPDWSWEPLAFDPSGGMPTFVYDDRSNPVSFWVKLTVGGVTRLGVGTCPPGQSDAEKVLIGDALRNAAMRFGVALDLWIKGHGEDDEKNTGGRQSGHGRTAAKPAGLEVIEGLIARLNGIPGVPERAAAKKEFVARFGKPDLLKQSQVSGADALVASHEVNGQGSGGATDSDAVDSNGATPPGVVQGGYDTPPEPVNPQGQTPPAVLNVRDVATKASLVFKADYDAAPKGSKTKVVDRLRHALIYVCTERTAASLNDLTPAQLVKVWSALDDVAAGRLVIDGDPLDDTGEATFTLTGSGKTVTVSWADTEMAHASAGSAT